MTTRTRKAGRGIARPVTPAPAGPPTFATSAEARKWADWQLRPATRARRTVADDLHAALANAYYYISRHHDRLARHWEETQSHCDHCGYSHGDICSRYWHDQIAALTDRLSRVRPKRSR